MCNDWDETQPLMEFVPPDDAGNTSFIKQSLSKEAGAARESTLLEAEAQV